MRDIIIATIVVILIFLILHIYTCNRLMTGYWAASSGFCEQAGLSMMLLYIDSSYFNKTGYIVAATHDNVILNDPTTVTLSGWNLSPFEKTYTVQFGTEYDYFPDVQKMTYYPFEGKIVLSNGDTVRAVLYRDTSYSCADMPRELLQDNGEQNEDTNAGEPDELTE